MCHAQGVYTKRIKNIQLLSLDYQATEYFKITKSKI